MARLPRRRRGRGPAHPQVVRQLRRRGRRRARGDRLRARLARHARLPGAATGAATACGSCATASTVLSQLPNATIYLEAGASDWEPAERTAKQLRFIGVPQGARLHAQRDPPRLDARQHPHGLDISRRVGGKPFIINTSYNGRGPIHYRRWIDRSRHIWRTHQRLVPPGPARPRPAADHGHLATRRSTPTCTSTAPATRPARATAARCRSAPGGPSAALMYAQYATELGGAAARDPLRALQALLAAGARRLRLT